MRSLQNLMTMFSFDEVGSFMLVRQYGKCLLVLNAATGRLFANYHFSWIGTMRTAVKWGILFGIAATIWTAAVHLAGFYTNRVEYAKLVDTLAIIIPLVIFPIALLARRRELGGSISFGQGLLTGLVVAVVAAPITVLFLWAYHHYINPDWITILADYERESLTAAGASEAEIAASVDRLYQGGTDSAQILGGLIGTTILGLILSSVVTGILILTNRIKK